ncbi:Mitochondrial ribonuclease P protein 1 -like protein [Halotydeus destructor]|nr:Mitochondrial ribonuclease P protein 1 -like protein [Halotydeus destructor]
MRHCSSGSADKISTILSEEDVEAFKEITSMQEDNREFDELTVDRYEELITSDEERRLVEVILSDYEYLKYTTYRVPTTIEVKQMKELMARCKVGNTKAATKFFDYMFKTEMAKRAQLRRKVEIKRRKQEELSQSSRPTEAPGVLFDDMNRPVYRPWHNQIVPWMTERDLRYVSDYKRLNAAMWGSKFVFDFDYEDIMRKQDVINLAKQLACCYGANYTSKSPFDLYFCNYKVPSLTDEYMSKAIGNLYESQTFIEKSDKCYTEIFPKDRLIYLTPNASTKLQDIDDDDIIIMGALVDRVVQKPVSFAKAKKQGIRMAKIPIDDYVLWGSASKVLTLNQVLSILLDFRTNGKDWKASLLKNIPSRKLKSPEEVAEEERIRLEKLTFRRKNFFKVSSGKKEFTQRSFDVSQHLRNS